MALSSWERCACGARRSFAGGDTGLAAIGTAYACWFCGKNITSADTGAVVIGIAPLWPWDSGLAGEEYPSQQIYAHSTCAKARLNGANMRLEPEIFGETFGEGE